MPTALRCPAAPFDVLAQPKNEYIRDAAIHRFKYTFELVWKTTRRHLDWMGESDTAGMSRKDLFRRASRIGLIPDAEPWFRYNQARNESSHTYNRAVAENVFEQAQKFLPDVQELAENLGQIHS